MAKKENKESESVQDVESVEGNVNTDRPEGPIMVVSGAGYHDFNEEPIFKGYYQSPLIGEKGDKEGKVLGFNFVDKETGELTIITSAHSIEKALNFKLPNGALCGEEKNLFFIIEFLEKVTLDNGQTFNKFKIQVEYDKPEKS